MKDIETRKVIVDGEEEEIIVSYDSEDDDLYLEPIDFDKTQILDNLDNTQEIEVVNNE